MVLAEHRGRGWLALAGSILPLPLSLLAVGLFLLCPSPLRAQPAGLMPEYKALLWADPNFPEEELKRALDEALRSAERYGIDTDFVIAVLAAEASLGLRGEQSQLRREFHLQLAGGGDALLRKVPKVYQDIPLAVDALYYALMVAKSRGEKLSGALTYYWEAGRGERDSTQRFLSLAEERFNQLRNRPEPPPESGSYLRVTDFSMPILGSESLAQPAERFPGKKNLRLKRYAGEEAYAQVAMNYNPRLSQEEALRIARAILTFSEEVGIDPRLMVALIIQESGFKTRVVSRAGAMGIAQLMPATARTFGVDPFDPVQSIWAATRYLKREMDRFRQWDDPLTLALAAYNAGAGAVLKYKGIPPYRETQNYIRSINALYKRLSS